MRAGRSATLAVLAILVVLSGVTGLAPGAAAQPFIVDLSKKLVAITAGFTGTEVLLFGTTEGRGRVVVVIEGPTEPIGIRRKKRVAGIWVNGEEVVFENAPAFYQVMASDTLDEWLPLSVREASQIGVEYLDLQPRGDIGPAKAAEFRAALVRNMQRNGHYGEVEGNLTMIGDRLFRATVFFPANVPVGIYMIRTMLVIDRKVVSTRVTPLTIKKIGIEADVYRVAHQHSALFGIAAIVIAVIAGLGANALFRKT